MTTIIIAEKPDAAERLALALADGKPKKKSSNQGVSYYEFERNGKKHIVVAAVGHLFNLKQTGGKGWTYPVFDVEWFPSYKIRKQSAFSEKYFRTIEEVVKSSGKDCDYISAADYDNEGSTIAYNILRFICNASDAKRMKFSTLTKQDLIKAYDDASPKLDFPQIEAGMARHTLDFFYGVNTSRALTLAIKKAAKRFAVLSAGRVQGPVLCMLAEKEDEIRKFVPKPYWQIELKLDVKGQEIIAQHEDEKIWNEADAKKIFSKCKSKSAEVESVEKKNYRQSPPVPFNITSLQTEAYRFFGFSPQQTLSIAQELYTKAYISYPRTSSEKLPPQIGFREILQALAKSGKYEKICKQLLDLPELKPNEGKRIDPAHESIHPTVEPPKKILAAMQQKIYDLVCKRFLAVFGKEALRETVKVSALLDGNRFVFTGRRTLEKGWMELYGQYAKFDEIILPEMKKGDALDVKKLDMLSKQTAPPPRFSQASMIKEMEKRELGTRATRAAIMQTLYDRNYIQDKSLKVTDLGMKVADTLKKYVPDLVDEKLTRKFEKDLEKIMDGKIKKEKVLEQAKKALIRICDEFRKNEDKIGKGLADSVMKTQDDRAVLGKCLKCSEGELKVMFNPFSKKSFVGCTSYGRCAVCGFTKKACKCKCPVCGGEKGKCVCDWKQKIWTPKCQNAFPLPGGAAIQKTDKICELCKTPIITVIRKGRRPFRMCLFPECKSKEDWGKKKEGKIGKKKFARKKIIVKKE
ncbi:MAG: DNA topoisomerase I [Candidatus Aenigmatarchaeota archaeon]